MPSTVTGTPSLLHAAVRGAHGTLLFRTTDEARALWFQVTGRVGARLRSLVLMPDHLHSGLPDLDAWHDFSEALRAYAMQRNRARGETGPVFEHGALPTTVEGLDKVRRMVRYIHLNPCRAGLAADPLAWPFSTHRDASGFAIPPACAPVRDPERFHAYVSADPSVDPAGTPLPRGFAGERAPTLDELVAAVAALTRHTTTSLRQDRAARNLLIRAARRLGQARAVEVAAYLEVTPRTVQREGAALDVALQTVAKVLGDGRFTALEEGDLRRLPTWHRYRHLR